MITVFDLACARRVCSRVIVWVRNAARAKGPGRCPSCGCAMWDVLKIGAGR